MPLYEYKCSNCHQRIELVQKINDKPPKKCPRCGSPLVKVISAPSLHFKGTGWYITDNAPKRNHSNDEPPKEKENGPKKEAAPKEKPSSD